MAQPHSRFMTTPMLVNAATQAERHAFGQTVDLEWLKYRIKPSGFHLATVIVPNVKTDRILLPHHRTAVLMKQSRGDDSTEFALDIALDAWEMLIPVSQLRQFRKDLQSFPIGSYFDNI